MDANSIKQCEEFIGTKIGVFGDNNEIIKEITVKNAKEVDGTLIVVDEDGDIYTETELNLNYKLTPKGIFYGVLAETGIIGVCENEKVSDKSIDDAFELFMERMVNLGYLIENKEE